jgi:hypothetical protein
MLPRLLRLHPSTYQRLIRPMKEAEREGAYRDSGPVTYGLDSQYVPVLMRECIARPNRNKSR